MDTPDQKAAEKIGRAVDGQIFRLQEERETLLQAAARIAEIDAELAVLQAEKVRIDSRRPPRPVPVGAGPLTPDSPPGRVNR
jgi:hypothetical protein